MRTGEDHKLSSQVLKCSSFHFNILWIKVFSSKYSLNKTGITDSSLYFIPKIYISSITLFFKLQNDPHFCLFLNFFTVTIFVPSTTHSQLLYQQLYQLYWFQKTYRFMVLAWRSLAQISLISYFLMHHFPGGTNGKEPTCQCRRHKRCWFHRWVGKIPWRRKWQLALVFLPGKFHG